jgi:apolipoprotein N-acyltransferase
MIRIADWLAELSPRKAALVALVAGATAALAMPPIDFWPGLAVAVPVLLVLLDNNRIHPAKRSFVIGWLFGLGYFLVALHWIGAAFFVDAATYLWMMPFAVGGLAAFMAVYWGLATLACRLLRLQGLALVYGFATAMGAAEWLRGHLFTGFPWAAPGLAVDGMGALDQLAAAIGMTGLTLVIILWAGLPVVFIQRKDRGGLRLALALAMTLPVSWLGGNYVLSRASLGMVPGVTLRLVQPNISQSEKWREDNARPIFNTLIAMSAAAPTDGGPRPTHIIWPESAVPFLIDESAVAKSELAHMLGGRQVLVTGAIRRDLVAGRSLDDAAYHNSVIIFDGEADVVGHYDKWRLVPGGEFLPLAWLLEPLGFRKIVTVPGSFVPGTGPRTLVLPAAPPVALLVCYEVIFPNDLIDPRDRPSWIINVTNDGWFGKSTGPYQHLAQARLRAVEQGIPIVRVANTGISAVIDSHGRIIARTTLAHAAFIDSPLPYPARLTVYGKIGDAALLALCLLTAAMAGLTRRQAMGQRSGKIRSSLLRYWLG